MGDPTERANRSERGQALVEFALLTPLVMLLLLTIVEFAIAIDRREVLQHAVREGGRAGAVGASTADIETAVVDQSQGTLESTDVDVCYLPGPAGQAAGTAGSKVQVSATYEFNFGFGVGDLLTGLGGDPSLWTVTMEPNATTRMEASQAGALPCQ